MQTFNAARVAGEPVERSLESLAAEGIDAERHPPEDLDEETAAFGAAPPPGAQTMRGFARRFRKEPQDTAEWMVELRAGEAE